MWLSYCVVLCVDDSIAISTELSAERIRQALTVPVNRINIKRARTQRPTHHTNDCLIDLRCTDNLLHDQARIAYSAVRAISRAGVRNKQADWYTTGKFKTLIIVFLLCNV